MTGKDLIIYILENNLEDESITQIIKSVFVTPEQVAIRFGVGEATVKSWCKLGYIPYVKLGNGFYIPSDVKDPRVVE